MNKPDNADTKLLNELFQMYTLEQHVRFPTSISGNCIDLVITRSDEKDICAYGGSFLTDHQSVLCCLDICKNPPIYKEVENRKLKNIDVDKFNVWILKSCFRSGSKITVTGS